MQAKDAQVAAKATEDAEKAARSAQEAQVAKAANPPKATPGPAKASSGKAATPVQQFKVDNSLSPENDDFQQDTPGPKLNPRTVRYPSHTPTSRAKGRPRKSLQPWTMDDKPIGATKEELLCWQKKFTAATWRYKVLSSDVAKSYREAENKRVKRRLEMQRQHIIDAASGSLEVYKHIPESPKTIAREKSHQR